VAAQTPDFGLNYFGPGVPGSLTDDGSKFTLGDRLLISRILKALEAHHHEGGDKLAAPVGSPAVALDTLSGQLPGGANIYYRVSYVDQFGLETAASSEVVQATPVPLGSPVAPTLAAAELGVLTGPGLATDDYSYGLTAISGDQETPLGEVATLSLDGTLPTVVVTFPEPQGGQDSWGVWRMASHDAGWTKVETVAITELDFTDDGTTPPNPCACDPTDAPPTENLTASTNMITVSVPDPALVGADPSAVKRWRLYRTYTSGSYASSSLVAEVVTTVNEDGTGGLVTSYDDDGTEALSLGQPLEVSQCLIPSTAITGGGGGISALLLSDALPVVPPTFTDDFNRTDRALAGDNGWFAADPAATAELAIRSNRATVPSTAPGGTFAGYAPILHDRNDDNTFADVSLTMIFDGSGACDTTLVPASDATFINGVGVEVQSAIAPQPIAMVAGGTYYLAWDVDHGVFAFFPGATSVIRATYDATTKMLLVYQDGVLCFECNVGAQMVAFGAPIAALATMPNAGFASNGGLATTEGVEHYEDFTVGTPALPVTIWRVIADLTGALVTRTSGGTAPASGTFLQSDDLTFWKLTIDMTGALTTTAAVPTSADTVYQVGQGPLLPCSDPTVAWQLGVANDGSLTTVEV
jgi:hypothetical protein